MPDLYGRSTNWDSAMKLEICKLEPATTPHHVLGCHVVKLSNVFLNYGICGYLLKQPGEGYKFSFYNHFMESNPGCGYPPDGVYSFPGMLIETERDAESAISHYLKRLFAVEGVKHG